MISIDEINKLKGKLENTSMRIEFKKKASELEWVLQEDNQ